MRVEVAELTRRFGKLKALDDVSFELLPGQRVALVGPNGSGKSTLNRALVGLIAHEGRISLDGVSPRSRTSELAQRIAYVPQVAPQLGAPVRELVRALCSLRELPLQAVAERADGLGLDLAAIASLPLRSLSGGMRQKLLLALAMAAPTSLLVLDEPTGSLDPATRQRFFAAFREAAGDATVVLCSHRLEEVRALVDHVLVLEEGRLVHDGPAAAFLQACAAYTLRVRVESSEAARWLSQQGFRAETDGFWSRTAALEQKRELVRSVARELGGALLDLEIEPIERLDLPSPASGKVADLSARRRRRA
jgi:ABC-type multidrug transport system ATPase subunit